MTTATDPIEHLITQVLNEFLLQTSSAPPIIPETPEEMAAQHDHQVRSLIEASVPPNLIEPLLHWMQPHRPDLDSCRQWVDDLTALDRALPSINRRLSDDAKQQPPTVRDLATWISEEACPATVLESTACHIKAVLEATAEQLSATDPEQGQIRAYLSGRDFACFATEAYLDAANTIASVAVADRHYRKPQGSDGDPEMAPSHRFAHLTRPIDPIVIAWQTRAIPADPDLRDRGIVPGAALAIQPRQGALFSLSRLADKIHIMDPVYLPGTAPQRLPNATPILAIFSAVGLSPVITLGRKGEAIDWRLFLEGLMTVPVARRHAGMVSVPLRTVRDWIWPGLRWTRSRDWPRLEAAFRSVNAVTLPWEGLIDGARQAIRYAPMTIVRWPQHGELDGLVVIHCRIPKGGAQGALVDRAQLRIYGATDALAWRLYLNAAHFWNERMTYQGRLLSPTVPEVVRGENGVILDMDGQIVRDDSGRPSKNWAHPLAVQTGKTEENPAARRFDGMRVFTADDLVSWAYPGQHPTGALRRQCRRRAVETLLQMAKEGALQALEGKTAEGVPGWQILRPHHLYVRR